MGLGIRMSSGGEGERWQGHCKGFAARTGHYRGLAAVEWLGTSTN